LFGEILFPNQAPPPKASEPVKPQVVIERRVERQIPMMVPRYVRQVPPEHFAGVSAPCKSLAEARRSAVDDVVRQILSAVNVRYDHQYQDWISGSARNPHRKVNDQLSKVAKGVVLGVEQNIVNSDWIKNGSDRYIFFILVRYPDKLIAEMRRLSKGAKVVASVSRYSGNELVLDVVEINGVEVVLSSADITVKKVNRFAAFISYYIWKVPKGSKGKFTKAIGPARVCGNSSKVRLKVSGTEKQMCDYLLGSEVSAMAVLRGHDEIGRLVHVRVEF
jgi:hypothetical protein